MSVTLIEDLAYTLKKGKEDGQKAIVFLGAGASKTGGIPLAGELMTEILKRYADVPAVKRLSLDDQKSYTKVMAALGPADRKTLFKEYIDKASINASHIYLAHMMKEGFIDFVFTVNFDNLMQRALGLFNMYPAVYDMAMLKGMTTAPFESPGLVYLHGQYHGFNLLNTEAEFKSVSELLKRCFIYVANRPWIMVGYSGEDPILDYINELGRFEHGLYWICYKDKSPSDRVSNFFFSSTDKNAFPLKGCDADSFFVKLHAELGLAQPPIIDTPFSYLKSLQESIVDIEGDDLKKANERLSITKDWISQAITTYEHEGTAPILDLDKIELEKIRKNLIDLIITRKYDQLSGFNKYQNVPLLKGNLSIGYNNWGVSLNNLGEAALGDEAITYFKEAIEKYEHAVSLKPDYEIAYVNWGNSLNNLGEAAAGDEAITYFKEAIEKYEHAVSLKPDDADVYYNWGISLDDLGQAATGTEAITYFKQAIEKYERAVSLKPDDANAYYNCGISLNNLGRIASDEEASAYFKQAIENYQKAVSLKPDDANAYNNWGNSLNNLGRIATGSEAINYFKQAIEKYAHAVNLKPDEADFYNNSGISLNNLGLAATGDEAVTYFKKAIEKFEHTVSLKPDDSDAYNNWGTSLNNLGQAATGEDAITYFKQAIEKYEKAVSLKTDYAIAYNNWGISLDNLGQAVTGAEAITYFKEAIEKYEKAVSLKMDNATAYSNWGNSLDNLGQIATGAEAITYFKQAIEKYEQTISLEPDDASAYNNYCSTLLRLNYLLGEDEKNVILAQALVIAKKGYALDGNSYNLSCTYALINDTTNAFKYLEDALQKGEIAFSHISEDKDWDQLRTHPEYLRLAEQYNNKA